MKVIIIGFLVALSSLAYSQNTVAGKGSVQSQKIPYGNNASAGHYVQSGDARIYYEVYGKGKPFVLLHGGGGAGSIGELGQFIDSLSKSYQVIAINTRGHGKSEVGDSQVTYEQKITDVITAINDVTKDSVIVLGFSDGAYTGYKLASVYPDRVKKLVAIGAGEQVPGLRKVVLDFNPESPFWKTRLATYPQPERMPTYMKNLENFYNTMVVSKKLLGSIKCPVLVMSGELDLNAPLATVIDAYKMIPNSQLSIIPNAGHVVFFQNFPAVWASIKPFL